VSAVDLVMPVALAYSRHVGFTLAPDELRADAARRLAMLPTASRLLIVWGALFLRWAAPTLLLGRPAAFDSLDAEDAEVLLHLLQRSRLLAIRGPFLTLKSLLLPLCYGRPEYLAALGYAPRLGTPAAK